MKTHPALFLRQLIIMLTLVMGYPCLALAESSAQTETEKLFQHNQSSLYQIRVIELSTGNKSTIGSGFMVGKAGLIASNFHVISHKIHHPDRYRLEYEDNEGNTGDLNVVDFDVVHDLALVRAQIENQKQLGINTDSIAKGTKLYSLGNPHDLGLSIVEGTYNGLLEKSMYDKIFFSGSLNPGMSGGPTLNSRGEVVGINVSTAGNQVSFLVPVKYLKALIEESNSGATELKQDEFNRRIESQIYQHQQSYLQALLDKDWDSTQFAGFTLPGTIEEIFKCWGDSDNRKDALIDHSYSNCFSEDRIYLKSFFYTGRLAYTYDMYRARDIGSLHFYNIYRARFDRSLQVNGAGKEHVSNYQCHTDFVEVNDKDWKTVMCARHYLDYPSLYDVFFKMGLVSNSKDGLIIQLGIAGVSKELSLAFIKRFIKEINTKEIKAAESE